MFLYMFQLMPIYSSCIIELQQVRIILMLQIIIANFIPQWIFTSEACYWLHVISFDVFQLVPAFQLFYTSNFARAYIHTYNAERSIHMPQDELLTAVFYCYCYMSAFKYSLNIIMVTLHDLVSPIAHYGSRDRLVGGDQALQHLS